MPLSTLVGNERIKKLLKRAVAEGRIAQGLIFAGPSGIGKRQFAFALAQAVNCLSPVNGDACGECIPCRKIEAREHTDIETYAPDGAFIKIEQMRAMAEKAQYRPYEGRRRVFIVDEAERMNQAAANSILKVLEEPPESSQLILLTAKPYALLTTIRSRCQMMSFAPLTPVEMEAYLRANYKRPDEETRMLARLARGSIGRALEIDLGIYREQRAMMMEMIEAQAVTRDTVKLLSAAEYLGRKLDREAFEKHLDVLMTLLSDLFHMKLGDPVQSLTNADIARQLERIAEAVSIDQITDFVGRIEQILQSLTRNVSRQLAMESALIAS